MIKKIKELKEIWNLSVVNIASVIRASYPAIYKVLKNELVFQTDYLNKKEQINRVVLNQKVVADIGFNIQGLVANTQIN